MPYKHIGLSFADALPYLDSIRQTVSLDDPNTLWQALDSYLRFCADTGFLIGNKTLYYACRVSKETVFTWSHGTRKQHNPEYKRFADMLKTVCACAREMYGLEGIVSPVMTIFHQKFYDGFKDDPGDEVIPNPLGDLPDADKLIQKYGGLFDE